MELYSLLDRTSLSTALTIVFGRSRFLTTMDKSCLSQGYSTLPSNELRACGTISFQVAVEH